MVEAIHSEEPLIFVGGSAINWPHLLEHSNFNIVAVDGGGNDLQARGLHPQYVCGDFDSIDPAQLEDLRVQGAEIIALPDQNATDFQKALKQFSAPVIYGYGFLDGRIDHGLDALAQIVKHADRRIYLIGTTDLAFVLPPRANFSIEAHSRISFWTPGDAQIAQSHGLKWSMDGLHISPDSMSISNQATSDHVIIDYQGDPLIAFVPIEAIALIN